MNVLVTGGTGYIGLNVVYELIERADVTVLVRDSSPVRWLPDEVKTISGSVTDRDSLDEAFETCKPDAVIHLAAVHGRYNNSATAQTGVDWEYIERVNVSGTEAILECAESHDVESVVFTSTIKAHPDISYDGESDYITSKVQADKLFTEEEWSFQYSIVHPTMVVGPRDYRLVHFQLFQLVQSNLLLVPPLYVPKRLNVVPMYNVVQTIAHAAENARDERHVVSGENIRMRTYMRQIAAVSEQSGYTVPFPFGRQILPKLIDFGASKGILPVTSAAFNWSHRDVPEELAEQCPVDGISWRETVERSYSWYSQMELV